MSTPTSSIRKKRKRENDEGHGSLPVRSRQPSSILRGESLKREMSLVYVRNALKEKSKGVNTDFDQLVGRFSRSHIKKSVEESSFELGFWVSALTHVVSGLERAHATLVYALIAIPWAVMDDQFVKSYTGFIGMLISARPEYLKPVLSQISQSFTYKAALDMLELKGLESLKRPRGDLQDIYDRVHALLQRLISLVPTLSSSLEPFLTRNFPHKRQAKDAHIVYIRNILHVANYSLELSDRILATVVDRAIQIDVEIQVELEELDETLLDPIGLCESDSFGGPEEAKEDEEEEDGDDDLSDLSSVGSSEETEAPAMSSAKVAEMVCKLDCIMELLFAHLADPPTIIPEPTSSDPSFASSPLRYSPSLPPVDVAAARQARFMTLLTIFDRTILRTFKSRYTQFIVFWHSSQSPQFVDLFLGLLIKRALFEVDQPAVTRSVAASYVGSLVSRALFVDRTSARRTVCLLCDFLRTQLAYVDDLVTESTGGSISLPVSHFSVFYAVAQATFLIFCFRWRDFLLEDRVEGDEDEDEESMNWGNSRGTSTKKWIAELDVIQRVITSSLNPLKICSPSVVKQFARIAQHTGFVYCHGIMESNRRDVWTSPTTTSKGALSVPSTPTGGIRRAGPKVTLVEDGVEADLNTFFPFDPYKLPRSHAYLDGIYREWRMVAIDDEEESDEDDDDEVDDSVALVRQDEAEDDDEGHLGASFNEMSITDPIRRLDVNV